jgi:hypothetical protein
MSESELLLIGIRMILATNEAAHIEDWAKPGSLSHRKASVSQANLHLR